MDETTPGADELRIRSLLKKRGVGPDAEPAAVHDWWEPKTPPAVDEDEPDDVDEGPAPAGRFAPQPDYLPRPHMPAALTRVPERATAAISPATRRLLYNASAAGTGWLLGLYRLFADAIADCGQQTSISGALVLGVGGTLLIAHVWDRRTRHWWSGIAWAARIPLATAVLALALWAPAAS